MGDDIKLGRIAGFPLAMNWSVLVIAWLLTWSLADGSFPHSAPGHTTGTYWLAAAGAAAFFFLSLLAHEMSHALVAQRNGVEVKGLTLWLFGGVASLGGESPNAGADFRIAAAGPGTSLALAVGFGAVAVAFDVVGMSHLVVVAVRWLAGINLMLGIFNLIPGAPLDGGRVLRSYLWHRHGDRVRAAVSAARAGVTVGYGLIGLGLLQFLAGASVGGIWLVFIGWFVLSAARVEEAAVVTRDALGGLRVRDVMSPHPAVAPGWITVEELIERYLLGHRHSAYPVEALDGSIAGLVTLSQIRRVAPEQRGQLQVLDIAIPVAEVSVAAPDDALASVLEQLHPDAGGRVLVFDRGALVGIVTPADVARAAEVRGLHKSSGLGAP